MKLLVFLADSLRTFEKKGEVKLRYYNPDNMFSDVHFVSPSREDLGPERLQCLVGEARMTVHALGASYGAAGFLPWGRLNALVRAVSPDVIRAYDPGMWGWLAVRAARRHGVPSMISVHLNFDEQRRHERRPLHQIRLAFERATLRGATMVSCVSPHVASYVRRYRRGPVTVIPNRVETARFVPWPAVRAGGRLRIVSVGRLVRQKYQACLIRALPVLDATLTIIGDGPLRQPLHALARRLSVADRVEFIPSVPHAELHHHYQAADVFAIATHYEGFCIPVIEAMACELPVVVSNIGPLPELVGDAGMVVDNTSDAFARALQHLLRDPARRQQLGQQGRQRVMAMDVRLVEAQERSLYEGLVHTPRMAEALAC